VLIFVGKDSYRNQSCEFCSSGDASGGETPSSIPNLEVKPSSAYGTALVTVWESRSLPGDSFFSGTIFTTLAFWCFALLHSTLVSHRFERWVESRVGGVLTLALYRLTFTLINGVVLSILGLMVLTIPDRNLYSTSGALYWALRSMQIAGVALLLLSARDVDLLKFFGFRQAFYFLLRGEASEEQYPFREEELDISGMYEVVRHPMYFSALVMMWTTPAMSLTYLTLALNITLYFYIGSYLEERRLVALFGQQYVRYQAQVSRLFPWRWLLAFSRKGVLR
jgi:protein-S-isoprenylcysteine O-methyltransferase Ste14